MTSKKLNLLRSDLAAHTLVGKELIPPFQRLGVPTEQIMWARDLLPEFLWIDSLVQAYGERPSNRIFNDFLSAADRFNGHEIEILDGTVSAFRFVPADRRETFRTELQGTISNTVLKPFGSILGLYPECPMAWLMPDRPAVTEGAISSVRSAVARLLPGKDEYASFCRTLPLHRMLAHNKVFIVDTLTELIAAIETYPHGDRFRVEAFARQTHSMSFMHRSESDPSTYAWARTFWNANRKLTDCRYE